MAAARLVSETVSRTLSIPVPAMSSFSGAAYSATDSQSCIFSDSVSMTLSPVEPDTKQQDCDCKKDHFTCHSSFSLFRNRSEEVVPCLSWGTAGSHSGRIKPVLMFVSHC